MNIPNLTSNDLIILDKIRKDNTMAFYKNVTNFFITEMYRYIKENRVWRVSVMGETRSGKSEVGSTICFLYKNYWNKCLNEGLFDSLDIWELFPKQEIDFNVENVHGSQSDYIYYLRDSQKNNTLKFGQIHQIDESRSAIGGIGSFSEAIELENLNNIIAKFMQSEVWITPQKFETRNAPYGLYVYKKDMVNRKNWCLMFKIEMRANNTKSVVFLGWVDIPLHNNEEFRTKYNKKKNDWIMREVSGSGDKRIEERKKTSKLLANDPVFSKLSPSGKSFVLNKQQQLAILENYIIDNKTQNWNEIERFRIVDESRMIVMMDNDEDDDKNKGDDKNG